MPPKEQTVTSTTIRRCLKIKMGSIYFEKIEKIDKKNIKKIGESEGARVEKSVAGDSHLSQEEIEFEEENFFNGVKEVKVAEDEEDEEEKRFVYFSVLELVENGLNMVEFSQVMGDVEISVSIDKAD
eukprot:augustus_masked-scaffold_65-processed-gene-0.58-mRNA-1 protein AED:1.00 eAED:1.00 QI:0/-1/0/0/-1/1/1/0/126